MLLSTWLARYAYPVRDYTENLKNLIPGDWVDDAKCAGAEDPTPWWDKELIGVDAAMTLMRCVEACEGCPAIRQCAAYALESRAVGVVHAGVPLPAHQWYSPSYRSPARARALEAIAAGMPMHAAIAEHMCNTPVTRFLRRALIERIVAPGQPAPPPMTQERLDLYRRVAKSHRSRAYRANRGAPDKRGGHRG